VWIDQKNAEGSALNGDRDTPAATALAQGESITATITGQGYVTASSSRTAPTAPTAATAVKTVTAASTEYIIIWSDGTAGTGTVAFTTASGLSLGSKSFTFFGTRTKVTVVDKNWTIGREGTGSLGYTTGSATPDASTPAAFTIKVSDSGDRGSTAGTVSAVSSNTAVVSSVTCTAHSDLNPYSTSGIGGYNCEFATAPTAKSGDKATITFRVTDPAATNAAGYFTATADVTIGGKIATETAAFDKQLYGPGDAMILTKTGKDASGNPVYDGASSVSLSCNKTISGTTTDGLWSGAYVGGTSVAGNSADEILLAPASGGAFKCTGNGGASGLSVITASSSVTDATIAAIEASADAAAEAIDAANAATDAANLAAEAADAATVAAEEARDAADAATAAVEELATQVATLMAALKAQITTLANTVAKIAKKVKA
jgi:hypothetical protein